MEDGETSKRKNRNAVRKMAAGEEGCFQEANHHHRDLRVLPRANSRTGWDEGPGGTRGWWSLREDVFGNLGAAWPPGTPLGHQQQGSGWWG